MSFYRQHRASWLVHAVGNLPEQSPLGSRLYRSALAILSLPPFFPSMDPAGVSRLFFAGHLSPVSHYWDLCANVGDRRVKMSGGRL